MREQFRLDQAAALHQGQRTRGAESCSGVGSPSIRGFRLDVFHASKKDVCVLMLERSQGAADRVLGPALRIALHWISEEAIKSGQQIGSQLGELKLADEIRGFGDH